MYDNTLSVKKLKALKNLLTHLYKNGYFTKNILNLYVIY
jgi:hypothetical protein